MAKKKPATKPVPKTDPPLRLEWLTPAELAENPANWRTHPTSQVDALTAAIAEVGWAGACLYNERTKRLIDGHARKKVAVEQGTERIPVLVGNWTDEQEKKILATLDPLAAMAEADAEKLDALLREVQTGDQALADMLAKLAEDAGMYSVDGIDAPALADGDKAPFQQMTFTLHDDQAEVVQSAIDKAKSAGEFDTPNENSNGNALARIAESYIG